MEIKKARHPYRCPKCNKVGHWRSGVHFDHEMRCGDCDEVWDPSEVDEENRELARQQINTSGDGI